MRIRFAREAEATSRLDHPNIVGVRGAAGAASFTIGDTRRAIDIHARSPCLAQALAHVRTEEAPDAGDVSVSLTLR